MSTEHHSTGKPGDSPTNADVSFESSDINVRTILAYIFYLAVSVIIAFVASIFIFRFTTKMATESDTPMAPVHRGVGPTVPGGPHLQGVPYSPDDPQLDLRNKREADDAANEKLEWVDKQAGIARIPVDEAMKIIAAKGFPALPSAAPEKKK
jgi:hypothetical protein